MDYSWSWELAPWKIRRLDNTRPIFPYQNNDLEQENKSFRPKCPKLCCWNEYLDTAAVSLGLKFCVSNKLSGNVSIDGSWTAVWVRRRLPTSDGTASPFCHSCLCYSLAQYFFFLHQSLVFYNSSLPCHLCFTYSFWLTSFTPILS